MIETHELSRAAGALALVFGAGACSFPVRRLPPGVRYAGLAVLAVPVLLAPLLVPSRATGFRFVVALASIMVAVKLYDWVRSSGAGPMPGARTFLAYLFNESDLVHRRVAAQRIPPRRSDAIRLAWIIPVSLVCALAVLAAWRFDWRACPWTVEHAAKVILVCAFVQFGLNIGASARRLIGIPATDFSGWFFAAATPAEFWRRWNKPAGQFLHEYVYLPAGGSRCPFAAVMIVFAINGLVHEYVFGIAAGRVMGFAFPFFVIQGLATAATMRLRPRGWGRAIGILLSLGFNLASAMLLFACVNAFIPFYAARPG